MKKEILYWLILGIGCHFINAVMEYKFHFLGVLGSIILGYVLLKVVQTVINVFKNL